MRAADEVDPLAERIGAVNTLIRQHDGKLKAYNTDCSAAIEAIEKVLATHPYQDCDEEACDLGDSLWGEPPETDAAEPLSSDGPSPLDGLRVVVLGAGGAGKALAFGAADRGAHVIIANRYVLLSMSVYEYFLFQ